MKFLFVLRHAKSSKDDSSLIDYDRPLNARGLKTAPLMGRLAKQKEFSFDAVLSSPARRAKQTAELFSKEAHFKGQIDFIKSFYPGDPETYIDVLSQQNNEYKNILIVGHNLGLENFVEQLIRKHETLPTAALAQIQLPAKRWKDLSAQPHGQLIAVFRPKEIFKELNTD